MSVTEITPHTSNDTISTSYHTYRL